MWASAGSSLSSHMLHAISGSVSGTVIDSNHFQPQASRSKQRAQCSFDRVLLIASWNNNAKVGTISGIQQRQ
jgi:hypothetical protein